VPDGPDGPERPDDSSSLLEFRAVMARLRAECGWKSAQTHRSLARYLLEETHETLDAIETGTPDDLREELGDLLLQVYFHAAIAEEAGAFDLEDVAAGVVAKMRRRNPHVFGPDGADGLAGTDRPTDPAAVNELWESVKAAEKTRDGVLDGIAPTLPALLLADKVLDRLGRAGEPVEDVLARASAPRADDDGVGAELLQVVARARAAGVDPEQALRELARDLATERTD
jgi:XTP/dITP diphosphohydrolase